jgi:hypothetical protein
VAVAFVRTVKTASNATAVQIVYSNRRGSRDIEHIGSAHSPQEVEALKAVGRQRLHANQDSFEFGDGRPEGEVLPITSTRSRHLWDALCLAYTGLGFDTACGHDEVFQALVLARVIEPVSKLDTIRVLDEIGIVAPSYRTIVRRLPGYASDEWRQRLAQACAAHVGLGPATLVIYDVPAARLRADPEMVRARGSRFRRPRRQGPMTVSRRCGCLDNDGRQYGTRCPRLKDPKHGTWGYRFGTGTLIDRKSGRPKRLQISKGGFPTRKAALDAEAAERAKAARGSYVKPSSVILGEYATEWLQRRQATGNGLKPTTAANL